MTRSLTIVMYHYVRDLNGSRYPRINGLTIQGFRHQLAYISRFYNVVRMEDVVAACVDGGQLPPNPLLLTFDDGFCDHYDHVLPCLQEWKFPGAFFASSQPFVEGRALDVHKIHHVLAQVEDVNSLLGELVTLLRLEGGEDHEVALDSILGGYEAHRYDGLDITAFKRLLQRDLPRPLRERLVDHFFRKYVTSDEQAFCRDLYLTTAQVRDMQKAGMFFGCHGHAHLWLDRASAQEQRKDLDRSLDFLEAMGTDLERWVMCYPYGGATVGLANALRNQGCAVGLLAEPGIAHLDAHDHLLLPRLDTNHLPQEPVTSPNPWTVRAKGGA